MSGRKEVSIVIDNEGRDKGKVFRITEMPASQSEAWGMRLILAIGSRGIDVPPGALSMGLAGVMAMGVSSLFRLPWEDAKPLMDEMFACIKIQPDPGHPQVVRNLVETDIEEVATRIRLRDEVLYVHTGFSVAAQFLRYREAALAAAALAEAEKNGSDTQTSPPSSDELSPPS